MKYINPIFSKRNNDSSEKTVKATSSKATRKTRSDKTHDIKFVTTQILHMKLQTLCKQATRLYKPHTNERLTQTKFNTMLLRYGLNHQHIINWSADYTDKQGYMHVRPLEESEYTELAGPYGLSIRHRLSERRTVYCIVYSVVLWLERGGSLEEIVQ
ncbi:hypothetical protein [Bacillus cihuensis]|uniref:hypothetical protein n=1 Tax=Bacillus cihuensis TaxID=1208599 RepID=UPI00048E4144|nr:hypothetical protein [Bacillus cihuensis]